MKIGKVLIIGCIAGISVSMLSCAKQEKQEISFSKQIQPIIQTHCIECHQPGGAGYEASGLSMQSYDSLIKGTKFGPIIKPGDALSSTVMILIDGRADPSINMPHGDRTPLDSEQITAIETWINQGAKNN